METKSLLEPLIYLFGKGEGSCSPVSEARLINDVNHDQSEQDMVALDQEFVGTPPSTISQAGCVISLDVVFLARSQQPIEMLVR